MTRPPCLPGSLRHDPLHRNCRAGGCVPGALAGGVAVIGGRCMESNLLAPCGTSPVFRTGALPIGQSSLVESEGFEPSGQFPDHGLASRCNNRSANLPMINYMVRPAGFEPATPKLEKSCSIRLSYGRWCLVLNPAWISDRLCSPAHQKAAPA